MPPGQGRNTASSAGLTSSRVARLRRALLAWGATHGQPFPWRDARNPYWALVAGVASQQTQMARVFPLWERWTEAFPTVAEAAAADRASALRVWAGAGYPRRAIALRDAARICMAAHGGELPRGYEALVALPGVGPFTAAIVLCFGWGDDGVAVDTNVVRVIGRVVYGDMQPAVETSPAAIRDAAERLLPRANAGAWNAALMDFGAQVCTSRPHCEACPLARACRARAAFAAGAAPAPLRAQGRFEGSDRQWRGRILRALRHAEGPLRTSALLRDVADDGDEARARRLFDALCAEGLAWSRSGWCGLGDAPLARAEHGR